MRVLAHPTRVMRVRHAAIRRGVCRRCGRRPGVGVLLRLNRDGTWSCSKCLRES